jgi:hypothetical protein
VFEAARTTGKLAIGVDADQFNEAPGFVLTSMVKGIDASVLAAVRAVKDNQFTGGIQQFGLAENGVGYVYDDHNKTLIPADVRARLDALTTTPVAAAPETGKKAKKERKPKDPDAPKKSLSPYLLFCAAKRAEVPEGGAKLTVKDLGAQWKALTTEQQATYKAEPSEAE